MNKLILVMLLFMLFIPITFSEDFSLNTGWNLVSFPVLPENNSVSNVLNTVDYESVFAYIDGNWSSYSVSRPEFLNTLVYINFSQGYWVKMLNDAILTVNGSLLPTINIPLNPGWNLIGYSSNNIRNITEVLSGISYTDVFMYENSTWKSYMPGRPYFLNTLTEFKPGYGYWIKVNGSALLTITNNICIEDWVVNYGDCLINDLKLKYYIDSNDCNTTNDLPLDDGTYVSCNYCSPNLVNTSWSAWENIGSCQMNNTQLQRRSKTEYDANYSNCYRITGLASDLWNNGNNNTYYEYQTIFCDYCVPSLVNTSWSSWTNLACSGSQMNQSRYRVEYDSNNCNETVNKTYYEYMLVGPNLVNTTWSNWYNITACLPGDYYTQERNLTEYDAYGCALNKTYYEYRNLSCDYCSPVPANTSWSNWINQGGCLINDTQPQYRYKTEYDSNYNNCYAVTGLPSDLWVNNTYYEYNSTACNYCTSSWENINGSCRTDNTFVIGYVYTNTCCVETGLESDCNIPSNTTGSCDYYSLHAPVLEFIGNVMVNETGLVTITAYASDPDNDTLTYYINDTRFTKDNNSFTWQTGYDDAGIYNLRVNVSDGSLTDYQDLVVTVNNVNRAPIANNLSNSTQEDTLKELTLSCIDADNDAIAYIKVTEPSHGSLGSITGNKVNYTPIANYNGADSFTYKCNDGMDDSNIAYVTITVNAVNDAPVLSNIGNQVVYENRSLIIDVNASDADNDALTYRTNFTIGSFNSTTGILIWTPGFDDSGNYSVLFNVTDGIAADYEVINIETVDVNRAPVITAYNPESLTPSVNESSMLIFNVTASEPDGDGITYSWKLDGSEVSTTYNYTYLPSYDDAGSHIINVTVSDSSLTAVKQWNVTVLNVNRAPNITSYTPIGNITIAETENKFFNITHTDPDGDNVSFQWYENGELVYFSPGGMLFESNYTSAGLYNITVIVSDGYLTDSYEWWLNVTNINRAPNITNVNAPASINENDLLKLNFTALDFDEYDTSLDYEILKDGELVSSNSSYSWQTAHNDKGVYNFTFRVNDSYDAYDEEVRIVTINDTTAPVISLLNPVNQYYTNRSVNVNLTTDEEANCSYILYSNSSYITSGNISTLGYLFHNQTINTLQDSEDFNITVSCEDSAGNIAESSRMFKVDTVAPVFVLYPEAGSSTPRMEPGTLYYRYRGNKTVETYFDSLDVNNVSFYIANWTFYQENETTDGYSIRTSDFREICSSDTYSVFTNSSGHNFSNFTCNWDTIVDPFDARVFVKWEAYDNAGNIAIYPNITNYTNTTYYVDIDNIAPGTITNLQTSTPKIKKRITLNWTAPGDDGYGPGYVSYYIIKFSESPILTEQDFENSKSVNNTGGDTCNWISFEGAGGISFSGYEQSCNVTTGMELDNHTYYFAVKSVDEAGNIGNISNSASGITAYLDLETLWINLTLMKNGEKYNKTKNTIYLYDLVNVTGEVRNNGNRRESEYVSITEAGIRVKNQTVTLDPGESKIVSMIYNATNAMEFFTLGLIYSIPIVFENNNTNNAKGEIVDVWSVRSNMNLKWYDNTLYPNATEKANNLFYVDINVSNPLSSQIWDLPVSVSINGSFSINSTTNGFPTSVSCDLSKKNCWFDIGAYVYINNFYWIINGLPQATYNVSVLAGNPGDQLTISRIVTMS